MNEWAQHVEMQITILYVYNKQWYIYVHRKKALSALCFSTAHEENGITVMYTEWLKF